MGWRPLFRSWRKTLVERQLLKDEELEENDLLFEMMIDSVIDYIR